MNRHALGVIEFAEVLALVAGRASSTLGAAHVNALAPGDDLPWLESEHARVAAMRALIAAEMGWNQEPIPDVTGPLERLRVIGSRLSGRELLDMATLLRSSRRTIDALRDPRRPAVSVAVLGPIASRLTTAKELEAVIERSIADDGSVRDDASPTLRRVRRELRGAEGELVKLLERIMARLESHQQVPDMSVTVRNSRYVIPIRREARGTVGGIVHDTSGSGATLFVEPPAAVEAGNRIRELEAEEAEEVDRILLELADRIRPLHPGLESTLEALVLLDSLYARARFAIEFDCADATLVPAGQGFNVRHGRHPLLLAQGIAVVPFNLEMAADERTLLVSGPNTGGKTVLLKTLGLLSAMAQSGIPTPVAAGSRIAVYDDIFADVGDEQSIEASLSTFSAHLRNLSEILRAATDRSLVLVDELGSGTDPVEGAALGGAILEDLTARRAMTLATTHLGALKELAAEGSGVINASLQFDAVALAPTYLLIKGIPGRSYGISIARRLALPEPVLVRAEERLPKGERDVNALLAELEARAAALAAREADVAKADRSVKDRAYRVAERESRVRRGERDLERESRKEARRYLLDARAEIEKTIRDLKRTAAEEFEETARAARQQVEKMAADHGERLAELEQPVRRGVANVDDAVPQTGDIVEIGTLEGRTGRLLSVRDGEGLVAVGGIKMALPLTTLRRAANQQTPAEVVVPVLGDLPDVHAESEIDVRGMRVLEVEEIVMRAIDAAVRADLKALRIIHGKGTGALRERVAEMLRKDTRVRSFRLGVWNEGGNGVTVADL
jgi:DNA mismatch repair protein MutS2